MFSMMRRTRNMIGRENRHPNQEMTKLEISSEQMQIAALAGKTRQIAAVGQKFDYRFTTIDGSKTAGCTEPGEIHDP